MAADEIGQAVEMVVTALLCAALAWALILVCLARLRLEQRRRGRKAGAAGHARKEKTQ
ncbi:hypothetical protein [Faecalibacterium sp. An58]|uniref:hypothetical protein n=1 Tax=Faecalibacterium sp. An58 TaxID=1965648 RepID=UPI0013021548|nr:hypothetical protein [Faecalibacterium sp. An58]